MIHIIPAMAEPGGVSDYAGVLAERLSVSAQSGKLLLVGNSHFRSRTNLAVTRCNPEADSIYNALQLLSDGNVLLHYANYAYAKRGCPFWLVEALKKWKSESVTRKLVTIFHEVKAFGPPWRSSFWLAPFQRNIAREILNLSDSAVTSLELYKQSLARLNPEKENTIRLLPVFSTVGEPDVLLPWNDRLPRMILFGGRGARTRILKNSLSALRTACDILNIHEVFDIGPAISFPADLGNVRVESLGELDAEKVSNLMAEARAGFLDYPSDFLSKSTIFAAYCSHGLVPVTGSVGRGTEGRLKENFHYWRVSGNLQFDPERIAANALEWYRPHGLQKHVEHLLQFLHQGPVMPQHL